MSKVSCVKEIDNCEKYGLYDQDIWDGSIKKLRSHKTGCVWETRVPMTATKLKSGKISESYIWPHPQEHVMSVKCEQFLDELTVQV